MELTTIPILKKDKPLLDALHISHMAKTQKQISRYDFLSIIIKKYAEAVK